MFPSKAAMKNNNSIDDRTTMITRTPATYTTTPTIPTASYAEGRTN
jgi:hypothetical protein